MSREGTTAALAWTAALSMRRFTYFSLADCIGRDIKRVSAEVRKWEVAGKVSRVDDPGNKIVFALTDSAETIQPRSPKRRESLHGNMWTVMRGVPAFSPVDLVAQATTEQVKVSLKEAREYCGLLLRAGYLRVIQKAKPNRREASYKLIRNTGPFPPREKRVRAVFDPNSDSYVHHAGDRP